jgi:hypothetical protein
MTAARCLRGVAGPSGGPRGRLAFAGLAGFSHSWRGAPGEGALSVTPRGSAAVRPLSSTWWDAARWWTPALKATWSRAGAAHAGFSGEPGPWVGFCTGGPCGSGVRAVGARLRSDSMGRAGAAGSRKLAERTEGARSRAGAQPRRKFFFGQRPPIAAPDPSGQKRICLHIRGRWRFLQPNCFRSGPQGRAEIWSAKMRKRPRTLF